MASLHNKLLDEESLVESEPKTHSTRPGWKAMPYILGNDTVERLATFGMQTNFMVYLMNVYNMDQVFAANIMNTWLAVSNVVPLIGAFVADAYLGKFLTIAIASFANLIGLVILMLTAWVPQFHPSPCPLHLQHLGVCKGHTDFQFGFLILGLFWLSMGSGGIRPCSIPFAVDQFDLTTVEGRHGSSRFYSLYYTTQTAIMLINQTLLVYIEDSVSWTLGYGLFTVFMFVAIVFFFAGIRDYAYIKPEGSILASIAQVIVAARHKRHLQLPAVEDPQDAFYDPPFDNDSEEKLSLTHEFRCLNKAALVNENELNTNGSSKDPWSLCSVQQVEELKCLLKMLPIWVTSIIVSIPIGQLSIFSISQALKMDRHIGLNNIEIHAGTVNVISLLGIAILLPFYDQVISPAIEKITKHEGGLTTLQRIGLGHVSGILAIVVAGFVERKRRDLATFDDAVAPMSVFWLAPQFLLITCCHVFGTVGHTEFFNRESPDGMRSISNSLLCLNVSVGSNLSTFIVNIVHSYTGKEGQPDWLDSDIDKGRLDFFYFIIGGLAVLNLCYFIFCARRYSYKAIVKG